MNDNGLSVEGLAVTYGTVHALTDVSVSFRSGVTGLLGHNGAGKSTLMGVLAGTVRPAAGTVVLDGETVTGSRRERERLRARLGLLPQRFGFFPAFTVREMVEYAAWLHKVPRRRVPAAVDAALEQVRLGDRQRSRMRELSGGMAQRVGVACALVHEPSVLILDEPTNGLDIEQRGIFRQIVRDLDPATITIISSHLAEDIAALCDTVVVMSAGRVVRSASLHELAGIDPLGEVTGQQLEQAYLAALGGAA